MEAPKGGYKAVFTYRLRGVKPMSFDIVLESEEPAAAIGEAYSKALRMLTLANGWRGVLVVSWESPAGPIPIYRTIVKRPPAVGLGLITAFLKL